MADVLSQAQIDALLNAVRSGDKDLEQSSEKQEKKYLGPSRHDHKNLQSHQKHHLVTP